MAVYTHLENHDTFYTTLSFFILIIVLAGLIFCIIMTEIIVYDTGKMDQRTLNAITRLEKITTRIKSRYKNLNRGKWKRIHKKNHNKQIILKQKKEKLKIPSGITVEQIINLLFEAMLTELKDRSETKKNLVCILDHNSSITRPEKTLQEQSFRQNTLGLLIKTLSSFKPEMLEQFISPNIISSITYQDILDRLKKLQDQEGQLNIEEYDMINKILMRKNGEREDLKKIKMNEEIDLPPSITVEESNRTSSTSSCVEEVKINRLANDERIAVKSMPEKS